MKFTKGQSGNPKGRAVEAGKKELALALFGKRIDTALAVIDKHLKSGDPDLEQWAAKIVIEYVCGKPQQQVDANVSGGFKIVFSTPTKLT